MNHLILNRIQTPDGTILTIYHRHDYKEHVDKNGETYFVDGGLDYQRTSVNKEEADDLSLYDDQPFEIVRKTLHWGVNYDIDMNLLPETIWKPIYKLNTDHIRAILDGGYGSEWIREIMEGELYYRAIKK